MYQAKDKDIKTLYASIHKPGTSDIANSYVCQVCKDTGFEYHQAKELYKIDKTKYSDIIEKHIKTYGDLERPSQDYPIPCRNCKGSIKNQTKYFQERANIPSSFYNDSIENFKYDIYKNDKGETIDLTTYKNIIDSFINDFEKWSKDGKGLYIFSDTKGSGKTFLASCICNSLMKTHPYTTKFVSASNLLDIADRSNNSGNYSQDPLSLLCNCKILCIDDLGQKNCGTNYMNDVLFKIIDSRYQNKLVTIITSNEPLTKIELDDRIVDRLYSMSVRIKLPECRIRQTKSDTELKDFINGLGIELKPINFN